MSGSLTAIDAARRSHDTWRKQESCRTLRLRRWLRDPLLHFLLIGIALFGGYRWLNPPPDRADLADQIVLTSDDLRQIAIAWMAQGRSRPTPEQVVTLVEGKVREEVLYREALALGLDKDDTIVKRRLAQKMDFLAEDASSLREPNGRSSRLGSRRRSDAFARHPVPRSRTSTFVRQAWRGRQGRRRQGAWSHRRPTAGRKAALALGDPFMFQDVYGDRTPAQIGVGVRPRVRQGLVSGQAGTWQGPMHRATVGIWSSSTRSRRRACRRLRRSRRRSEPN